MMLVKLPVKCVTGNVLLVPLLTSVPLVITPNKDPPHLVTVLKVGKMLKTEPPLVKKWIILPE
jgi:hypothetical protein